MLQRLRDKGTSINEEGAPFWSLKCAIALLDQSISSRSPGGGVLGVCASKRLYGDFGGLIGDYGHLLFVCAVRIEVKHES